MPQRRPKAATLAALPPVYARSLWDAIARSVDASRRLVVALDDDPTGTQTVHGIPVLTAWEPEMLHAVFAEPGNVCYILTNSRSMQPDDARALNLAIAEAIHAASEATGRPFTLISRSDSTLRGHYPLEIDALAESLAARGQPVDGHLIVPYFLAGGRYTLDGVHYVADGDTLVPAAETEYARDASFGYTQSFLPAWVAEKSAGRWQPEQVAQVSLADLREGGPQRVAGILATLRDNQPCVVDAADDRDLEVLVAGLLAAEARGTRLLARSAASFVRVRGAIPTRGLLSASELVAPGGGPGLIVAGSYISTSGEQIRRALAVPQVTGVELAVDRVLDPAQAQTAIAEVAATADALMREGRVPLIYTSRTLRTGADAAASLAIGRTVSAALVEAVRSIQQRPGWIVAKGGITSSDVATKGLDIRRAEVLGQILPGVPVWRAGEESRFPGVSYVVFPGNVGGPDAIAEVVRMLGAQA
jgi:uncharacterized protein YgbK (DUF1537 family)